MRYLCAIGVFLSASVCFGAEGTLTASDLDAVGGMGGRVEGVIRYETDVDRPWRYGRYYVAGGKGGALAEAVVALERAGGEGDQGEHEAAEPRTNHVDQIDFMFVPETVALRAGDYVRFTNSDDAVHNVMTHDGSKPFNVNMARGEGYVRRFEESTGIGKPLRIGCVYHGGMRAWIYVFDHPYHTVTRQDGRFIFDRVAPGKYFLRVAHPAGRLGLERELEVGAGEKVRVEMTLSPDALKTFKR